MLRLNETTTTRPAVARTRGDGWSGLRRLVAVLALTQTVGYGVLYYAFAVLLAPMAQQLHTSTAVVTGALTTSVVVTAAAAIPIGRWLDSHGGRLLMTGGSVVGVGAVVLWSQVVSIWQLYAVFVLIGLAAAMSLYEAAFAVIVAASDAARRTAALVSVTIVAGFASSIFFPLTGLLLDRLGWRATLLVLATLLAVVAIPGHALTLPHGSKLPRSSRPTVGGGARLVLRDRRFWFLTAAFVTHSAAVSALGVHLVRLLTGAGHAVTVAATLAGLLGVLSVTGRLATTALTRRYSMAGVSAGVFFVQAAGAAALPLLGRTVAGAAACVTAFGIGFGVATIARPAIVADRYGTADYATIVATMSTPVTLAKAGAPLGAALLAPHHLALSVAAACALSGLLLLTVRHAGRQRAGPA